LPQAVVFTVGHSTLSREQFLALIGPDRIDLVWDVRSFPTSRWDHFRRERLEEWLPAAGVEYVWAPALGGRRSSRRPEGPRGAGSPVRDRAPGEPPGRDPDQGWQVEGFAAYEWHMTSAEFFAAADELAELGRRRPVAILCAEGVWWRCHRSMIADYLVTAGVEVVHLQPRRLVHAEVLAGRLPRYDPDVLAAWSRHLTS
jgi:uncharacterized protein (DUF488 family)